MYYMMKGDHSERGTLKSEKRRILKEIRKTQQEILETAKFYGTRLCESEDALSAVERKLKELEKEQN